MKQQDEFNLNDRPTGLKYYALIAGIVILLIAILAGAYYMFFGQKDKDTYESVSGEETIQSGEDVMDETEAQDPLSSENMISAESGAVTEITDILIAEGALENENTTIGIDVSKYQGNINWEQVAAAGIDFAMIRVGYRTMESGEIVADSSAKYNLQEATANGIKVGAYFFSTAVTEEEAVEEAKWTAEFISRYKVTYPVAYNCEGYENTRSRQYNLTKEERTNLARAFLNEIYDNGYTPMFYASRNELLNDNQWITSELEKSYKIWVSWYPALPYPEAPEADYSGTHSMWQYTNNGTVAGIDSPVDVNVAYFGYDAESAAKNSETPEQVGIDIEAGHNFTDVNETVTAKDSTNLRNIPSQGTDSQVMLILQNGQTATRTGISTSGWSRIVYNGETYYAVSSLLTTDLTVKTPEPVVQPTDDGIQTEFTACDEMVSPKIEVNLRNIPSVTSAESTVVVTAQYGEVFRRTGINNELGWSRVEYNGQTLYCVSSYVYVYEVPAAQ